MNELSYIFGLPSLVMMRPLDVMLLIHRIDPENRAVWLRLYANKVASIASFVCRWSPYRRLYIYTVSFPDSYIGNIDKSFSSMVYEKRVCLKYKDSMIARLKFSQIVLDYFTRYYTLVDAK